MYKYSIIKSKIFSWEKTIKKSLEPYIGLLFNRQYINDVISNVNNLGPYIVIYPGIAMPHARPYNNVKKNSVVVTKFKYDFNMLGKRVNVLITLAPVCNTKHMDVIKNIAKILINKKNIEKLFQAKTINDLKSIF